MNSSEVTRLGEQERIAWLPTKIISGGQAGVDRAALDWAIAHDVPHGGWCPKGRLTEDGVISSWYGLQETESAGYKQRTRLNVKDSDATLIFNEGVLDGGSRTTLEIAARANRHCRVFQLDDTTPEHSPSALVEWLATEMAKTLNVAGPRESKRPGIHSRVLAFLNACFALRPETTLPLPLFTLILE